MRIAIIAHLKHAIREPFTGGLEKHTAILARGLTRRGHDVTLFASTRSDPATKLEAICDETTLLEAGVEEASDPAFFLEHHAYLRLMLDLRHRSFDVIHNNSLHYLPISMADAIRTPMLTTLHTPPFCWLESGVRLGPPVMRYAAVSNATARMWSSIAPRIEVVPNGIDLSGITLNTSSDRDQYLVWCGRIVPEKGLELAIATALQVGLPLWIAGPVSDSAYYDAVIRPLLSDRAVHVGHLQQESLAALVGGAKVALVTPRWEEPYGLVVAEALASGTPVAAFRRGGVTEILDATCGALAEPDDVEDLARAVRRAMTLDRAACRRRAEQVCNAERMLDGYEAIYADLSSGQAQAPAARQDDWSNVGLAAAE